MVLTPTIVLMVALVVTRAAGLRDWSRGPQLSNSASEVMSVSLGAGPWATSAQGTEVRGGALNSVQLGQRECGGFSGAGGCLVEGGHEGPRVNQAHVLHHGPGLPQCGDPSLGSENTTGPLHSHCVSMWPGYQFRVINLRAVGAPRKGIEILFIP